jgi:hypothetical protein
VASQTTSSPRCTIHHPRRGTPLRCADGDSLCAASAALREHHGRRRLGVCGHTSRHGWRGAGRERRRIDAHPRHQHEHGRERRSLWGGRFRRRPAPDAHLPRFWRRHGRDEPSRRRDGASGRGPACDDDGRGWQVQHHAHAEHPGDADRRGREGRLPRGGGGVSQLADRPGRAGTDRRRAARQPTVSVGRPRHGQRVSRQQHEILRPLPHDVRGAVPELEARGGDAKHLRAGPLRGCRSVDRYRRSLSGRRRDLANGPRARLAPDHDGWQMLPGCRRPRRSQPSLRRQRAHVRRPVAACRASTDLVRAVRRLPRARRGRGGGASTRRSA